MMKPITLALSLLLAATTFAQDKLTLVPTRKVGDVTKHAWQMNINVMGQDVLVKANLEGKITKIEKDVLEATRLMKDFVVDMGGQSPNIPVEDMTIKSKLDNELIAVTGGAQGTDNFRNFLVLNFILPAGPIATGETYTKDVAAKGDNPAYKIITTYQQDEVVDGVKLHVFGAKLIEAGADGISADTKYWVSDSGDVVKAEAAFKNLPIPAAGQSVDGKMTLKTIK
jgi:hypothetical protein